MPGEPLSLPEREEISVALIEDRAASWASIAHRVGRPPTTVMREVTRNGGRARYRPAQSERRAERKRSRSAEPGGLRDRVRSELAEGRSPEAIWADLVADDYPGLVCVETIYSSVYDATLGLKATECLRSRRPRRRGRQVRNANKRAGLPNIALRPAAVNDREEPGHWEADQIIGANNKSSMLWLTERVTRFSIPVTMPNGYAAADALAGLVEALEQIPEHLRLSITFDQGSEWADWETLVATYGIDAWATRTRHGNAARSRTSTASGAGGSPAAPNSRPPNQPPRNTPQTSSTANAGAASTTRAPPPSTMPSPCSDR